MPVIEKDWWDYHANIVKLTAWMADHHYSAEEVAYAVEKPWKYADEWAASQEQ